MMNEVAICTISSANYFPFAKTMLDSVLQVHDDIDLFYLLVDKNDELQGKVTEKFNILKLDDLNTEHIKPMSFVYELVEMNTAVKPFLLKHLLDKGYNKVFYIDPDIFVYNRLDYAINLLDNYSVTVTPHMLAPVSNPEKFVSFLTWEQSMCLTGVYNLGFIGMASTGESYKFLEWWQSRCSYLCFMEPIKGLFVDQKWINLAPAFFESFYVMKNIGYNVSIWNLHERNLEGQMINDKEKLIFFHFSSIDIFDDMILSKHHKAITFNEYPGLIQIYSDYRKKVLGNQYTKFKSVPYAFNYFADGKKIDILERRLYSRIFEDYDNPFTDSRKTFYKKILYLSRKKNTGNMNGRLMPLIACYFIRIIGASRYSKMWTFFGKISNLRTQAMIITGR